MTKRKAIGWGLISVPFIIVTIVIGLRDGFSFAIPYVVGWLAVSAIVGKGVNLINE